MGPKTLGAQKETQGERPLSPPRPPRWSQGGVSSSEAGGLWRLLEEPPGAQWGAYGGCGSGSRSGHRDIVPSTAVDLRPGRGYETPSGADCPQSLEKRRSRAGLLGTLGERWLSRPEMVGQYPYGVSQSAVGRRRLGKGPLVPGTPLTPPCFGSREEVGA